MDPAHRLGAAAELAHYRTHENDPSDPGYRSFLSRLSIPLGERLAPGAEGLDYGSGPGPTLALMFQERGYSMRNFDPFFSPDSSVLERTYDFITATEVVEHFFSPGPEFDRLDRMLSPGGWLGVMTEVLDETRSLSTWRYARDPTHVSLYSGSTLKWIARHYGWTLERPRPTVFLFQKPNSEGPGPGRAPGEVNTR
jgi:hypothetical protein